MGFIVENEIAKPSTFISASETTSLGQYTIPAGTQVRSGVRLPFQPEHKYVLGSLYHSNRNTGTSLGQYAIPAGTEVRPWVSISFQLVQRYVLGSVYHSS